MPQRILGLDIGSYSVKGVLLEDSFRGFKVEAAKEVKIAAGTPETGAPAARTTVCRDFSSGAMRTPTILSLLGRIATFSTSNSTVT